MCRHGPRLQTNRNRRVRFCASSLAFWSIACDITWRPWIRGVARRNMGAKVEGMEGGDAIGSVSFGKERSVVRVGKGGGN